MYDQGLGVPRHHSRAMKWYRRAAQQGDATAQVTLALIYDEGRGVPQNDWQAVKWYGLAAEQGVVVAQKNLGVMYEKGRGVPQDHVQAYKWLSLATAAGELAAAKDRDAVSTKMTLEQMAQAKKLAMDWTLAKAQEKAAKCKDLQLEACN
jgi:TPR repeat protein